MASGSTDPTVVGHWLLAELISPSGNAKQAKAARQRLDEIGAQGMLADFARGLDDSSHGRVNQAADFYMKALSAAQSTETPLAPLVAWYSAREAESLNHVVPGLWKRWKKTVEDVIEKPGSIGWRARGDLVDWWADEAWASAVEDVEEQAAKRLGCLDALRLAGPFGRGEAADAVRSYAAEAPGPWPVRWEPDPSRAESPRVLQTDQDGCLGYADEATGDGMFYAESYIRLDAPRTVLVAVRGAHAVWVNDVLVLERDLRQWGVWPKFGVLLTLPAGRHRILAKLAEPEVSIQILHPDGRPVRLTSSADATPGYSLDPPQVLGDPNVLRRYVTGGKVRPPSDDVTRFLAAYLANYEGEADVASVLMEPLVDNAEKATGFSLAASANYVHRDPIYDPTQARDLVRELEARASKKDPGLWEAKLGTALWEAERSGPISAIKNIRELAKQFPKVFAIRQSLARLYGQLGWSAEYRQVVLDLLRDFPESPEALVAAVEIYDEEGARKKAEALVERIVKLDPDSEIRLTRALMREDYQAARTELERLAKRRPGREDIKDRVFDIMVRAGDESETWKKLEAAVDKNPKSERARLDLADANLASGKKRALAKALADAVQAGADISELEDALDLVEGMSALEPFRIDGRQVIAEYEARDQHMPGTAARILDYGAVWVHADGSSRMLEHEVIRIQSAEAISRFSEHPRLNGLVLHMRVIKKDGRILEPEFVSGKPTVTLPHLEVGDYIETEHVIWFPGDGNQGRRYLGPHWFFREENIAYARSEFVVVTPAGKDVVVETRNSVPAPKVTKLGPLTVRRWRVDASPAAPSEPHSAPLQEFLPSVRVGWGMDLEQSLLDLSDKLVDLTPVDPRIERIAKNIVKPIGPKEPLHRARLLYRWVLANVEDGSETDGRRVIVSKNGNRWRGFITLCRSLGIEVNYAIAKNRLETPAIGPLSRASEYKVPLLRIQDQKHPTWLTVNSKYAPFGYIPAEVRGMPGYLLAGERPTKVKVPSVGAQDGIRYSGSAKVRADGSAFTKLLLEFHGKYATGLRTALAQLPENRLHDVLESRLLGATLRGAQLKHYAINDLDDLDKPLSFELHAEVPHFAQLSGKTLILSPPFMPQLSGLARLPSRQTPLLIGEAEHHEVELSIEFPKNAKITSKIQSGQLKDADRRVTLKDELGQNALKLHRVVDMPAGRIQPADYAAFVEFARDADEALSSSIRIRL